MTYTNRKRRLRSSLIFSLAALPLLTFSVSAQTARHVLGVFAGATHFDSETNSTFGIEYEYRINPQWGMGAVYERTPDAHHHDGVTVALASAFYHPDQHWRFGVGVGEERVGGGHPHSETLYRISGNYDFHFDQFGVAPTLAVDVIDGDTAYVAGIAFTYAF
ncbi:porin family protein [Fluctibacter halophilus]|uniref:porin family protein n=1 Tax=Fluctibacter halophilus TaxID=226011 RepID=UPI001E60A7DB|nr:porin family protein [Aestuariibacter halophilus]